MRAGTYIRQATGYKAFVPKPLPPNPPVEFGAEMMDLLSRADTALGRLDGTADVLPNPDLFVAMYVKKEAVLSAQIEGTQASLDDLLAFEANMPIRRPELHVKEIVNYIKALYFGFERLASLPLSLRLIKELHEVILRDTRGGDRSPGEFRESQNWIGPAGCSLQDASFIPPPPHEMRQALGDLELFLHSDAPVPILLKAALVHAQFETIHPFLDGNGRMGRLLIAFLLSWKGVLKRPLLYLSYHFKKHRGEYYERLQAVRDDGDWEGWVRFFLQGVLATSEQATDTARKIHALHDVHRQIIHDRSKVSVNGLRLLDQLYQSPVTSAKKVAEVLGVSFPAANSLIGVFVDAGLLIETTGQARNRIFRYEPYWQLFEEGTAVP
jgi:cell filamentation protein, protein adenylyltransferase